MNAAQFLVGNLLNIKPILQIVDGVLEPFEKIRSVKKAKARILEIVAASNSKVYCVAHTNAEAEALLWKQDIQQLKPDAEIVVSELGPIVGIHTGEGTIGVVWLEKN